MSLPEELHTICHHCDSEFTLSFHDEEVAYKPTHCPFCGETFDEENDELDFNDEDDEVEDEEDFDDEEDDDFPDD